MIQTYGQKGSTGSDESHRVFVRRYVECYVYIGASTLTVYMSG